MRQLDLQEGGRPLANDDFAALQTDLTYATTALLQELPPHVVANCQVFHRGGNVYDIGYGIVWMAGQLLKFDGVSGITMPAEIVLDLVATYDERPYQTGGTKPCIVEQRTAARPATSENVVKVTFNSQGATLSYAKLQESRLRSMGEVQALANVAADDYVSGRGRLGTAAYGWGLCDGQEGRIDLRGRFVVGQHPDVADYDTIGKTGGSDNVRLTPAQMPSHSHGDGAFTELLQKAGFGNNNTAKETDGIGNGNGGEPDIKQTRSLRSAGSDQPHENRPPFYVLAYRQWIGL